MYLIYWIFIYFIYKGAKRALGLNTFGAKKFFSIYFSELVYCGIGWIRWSGWFLCCVLLLSQHVKSSAKITWIYILVFMLMLGPLTFY